MILAGLSSRAWTSNLMPVGQIQPKASFFTVPELTMSFNGKKQRRKNRRRRKRRRRGRKRRSIETYASGKA